MQASARFKPIGWRVRTREQRTILLIGDAFVSISALLGGLYFWGQKDAWLKFSLGFLQQRVEFWFYLLPLIWMVFLVELYDPHRAKNMRKTVAGISMAALAGLLVICIGLPHFAQRLSATPGDWRFPGFCIRSDPDLAAWSISRFLRPRHSCTGC